MFYKYYIHLCTGLLDENNPNIAEQIDLVFDEPEIRQKFEGLPISSQMTAYKSRIYAIVHGGYSLLTDSRANLQGTEIDGQIIRSVPVLEKNEFVGYKPSCPSKRVRDFALNFEKTRKMGSLFVF